MANPIKSVKFENVKTNKGNEYILYTDNLGNDIAMVKRVHGTWRVELCYPYDGSGLGISRNQWIALFRSAVWQELDAVGYALLAYAQEMNYNY